MAMSDYSHEVVSITAPLAAVPAMLEARDRFLAGERLAPIGESAPERTALVQGDVWAQCQVRQLRETLPYPAARVLIDMCAARAGEWITKAEGDAAAAVTPRQLANELGALS